MDILTTEEVLRAEANAIHGEDAIAGDLHGSALYRALGALDSAALCLSGGGIRSAAFALGVIQALASHPRSANGARVRCSDDSLLGKFHYLSTVSGGGYIGGWLSAGVARTGFGSLWPKLLDVRARPEEEPGEIAWLRRYSNYLTPKLGIGSADAWTVVAIFIRNLVLNWLVLLPVLCGTLLLLKLVAVGVAWLGKYPPDGCTPGVPLVLAAIGLVLLVAAVHFATRRRPSRTRQGATQPEFLIGDLLPAGLSGLMFTLALAVPCAHHYALPLPLFSWSGGSLVSFGVAAGVAAYGLGWLLALPRSRGRANFGLDFLAWTAAGAVYGALLGLGVYVHRLIYGIRHFGSRTAGIWGALGPDYSAGRRDHLRRALQLGSRIGRGSGMVRPRRRLVRGQRARLDDRDVSQSGGRPGHRASIRANIRQYLCKACDGAARPLVCRCDCGPG